MIKLSLGFLEDRTGPFVQELWRLLLSAQDTPTGIPPELISEKQEEKQRKMEQIQQA
jgi:serine/arginine repetitive matrix protein 1